MAPPHEQDQVRTTTTKPISPLAPINRIVTGHNSNGEAIAQISDSPPWTAFKDNIMAFSVLYTTNTFPATLSDDADIEAHKATLQSGTLGLVQPNGTVLRIVDFAPGSPALMHRTQSLDYGIVLDGEIDLELDSGEVHRMVRGDVAVQRATMHAWRNGSETQWCRMAFILQACKPVVLESGELKEDLGSSKALLAAAVDAEP